MPAPRLISDAERDLHRALCAARTLGGEVAHGLATAETLLAEVRHFAYDVSDSRACSSETASRLLSAILGFKVEVRAVDCDWALLEAYARLAR
jgi:hypothetical protein